MAIHLHYNLNQSFRHDLGFGLHLIFVLNFKKPISLTLKPGIANLVLKILFSVSGFRASVLREALILLKLHLDSGLACTDDQTKWLMTDWVQMYGGESLTGSAAAVGQTANVYVTSSELLASQTNRHHLSLSDTTYKHRKYCSNHADSPTVVTPPYYATLRSALALSCNTNSELQQKRLLHPCSRHSQPNDEEQLAKN